MLQLRQKKPYHIYKTETAQDKKLAQAEIDRWNEENKADCQTKWELATVMQRTHLTRNLGGQKPEWKWDKKHGKLVRDGKGGIDWYRYQNEVLRPKLLPFAIDCKKKQPNTIVIEDGAASQSHRYQQTIYSAFDIEHML